MNPFGKDSLTDLQDGINRLFEQVWHGGLRTGPFDGQDWAPALDVLERYDGYVIEIEIAGIPLSDIEVTGAEDRVTITGQKSREPDDSLRPVVTERRFGSFKRVVRLEEAIDSAGISAKLENGVLRIEAPRKHVAEAQSVKIRIDPAQP